MHKCGYDYEGAFLERLKKGTWIGHVLEHIIIELQLQIGLKNLFGQTRQTSKTGVYYMVFACQHEKLAREILHIGREFILSIFHQQPYDLIEKLNHLKELAYEVLPGPSSNLLCQAFSKQSYPLIRPTPYNLYQVGYGCQRQWFWTATTEHTNIISTEISKDKELTKQLLAECFIPVSQGVIVNSMEKAWEAAMHYQRIAIKPLNNRRGHGVSLDLSQQQDVFDAFNLAQNYSDDVLVEKYYLGNEYRFSLVDHQVNGVLSGQSLCVIGDGQSTIQQLIEQLNQEPGRGFNESFLLTAIEFDEHLMIYLQKQNVSLDTILPIDEKIEVRKNFNLKNVVPIEHFHPKIIEQVSLASQIIGLDLAGIDAVIQDITQPLSQENGVIIEVNAGPAFAIFHLQSEDKIVNVADEIAQSILKHKPKKEFQLIGLSGTYVPEQMAFFIKRLFSSKQVGIAIKQGLYLENKKQVAFAYDDLYTNGQRVLMNPFLDVGIIESSFESIVNSGMSYGLNRCDITVLMDVSPHQFDHSLLINSTKAIKKVFRTPLDLVPKHGLAIIHAANYELFEWAELVDGKLIFISCHNQIEHLESVQHSDYAILFRNKHQIMLKQNQSVEIIANCPELSEKELQIFLTGIAIGLFQGLSIQQVSRAWNDLYEENQIESA